MLSSSTSNWLLRITFTFSEHHQNSSSTSCALRLPPSRWTAARLCDIVYTIFSAVRHEWKQNSGKPGPPGAGETDHNKIVCGIRRFVNHLLRKKILFLSNGGRRAGENRRNCRHKGGERQRFGRTNGIFSSAILSGTACPPSSTAGCLPPQDGKNHTGCGIFPAGGAGGRTATAVGGRHGGERHHPP